MQPDASYIPCQRILVSWTRRLARGYMRPKRWVFGFELWTNGTRIDFSNAFSSFHRNRKHMPETVFRDSPSQYKYCHISYALALLQFCSLATFNSYHRKEQNKATHKVRLTALLACQCNLLPIRWRRRSRQDRPTWTTSQYDRRRRARCTADHPRGTKHWF